MSLEELMQEHIKALKENTKAILAYTQALHDESDGIEVEHTKNSACKFCGVSYKTLMVYVDSGKVNPYRRGNGKRLYFKEKDLVNLCESYRLFGGEYGELRNN